MFQNAHPVKRLRSVRMKQEELGAFAQDHLKSEAVVKALCFRWNNKV